MKDFPNASFPPEIIQLMTVAMNSALATLPHPASSTHVQSVAETILRTAKEGERDPKVLERMALLETSDFVPHFRSPTRSARRLSKKRNSARVLLLAIQVD